MAWQQWHVSCLPGHALVRGNLVLSSACRLIDVLSCQDDHDLQAVGDGALSQLMAGQAVLFQMVQQLSQEASQSKQQMQQLQLSSLQHSLHQDGCFANLGFSIRQIAASHQAELVRHTVQNAVPPGLQAAALPSEPLPGLPGQEPVPPRSRAAKRQRTAVAVAEGKVHKLQRAECTIRAAAVTGADPVLSPASKNLVAAQQQHQTAIAAAQAATLCPPAAAMLPGAIACPTAFPSADPVSPQRLAASASPLEQTLDSSPGAGASTPQHVQASLQASAPLIAGIAEPSSRTLPPAVHRLSGPAAPVAATGVSCPTHSLSQQPPAQPAASQPALSLALSLASPANPWTTWLGQYASLSGTCGCSKHHLSATR